MNDFRDPYSANPKPSPSNSRNEKSGLASSTSMDRMAMSDGPTRLSTCQLFLLTCSTGGLQLVWATIMANGTPFLITLGLPESLTALVWIAGPLCGAFVQPYVGVLSDRCQVSWGRRRPFILSGAIGAAICMVGLASTKAVWRSLATWFGADPRGDSVRMIMILSAIFWLYALNFFLQPLQSGNRALIVDSCPSRQQTLAAAWASRVVGLGNIIGYLASYLPVNKLLPFLTITQFSWLCMVTTVFLIAGVTLTCIFIKERDPRTLPLPSNQKKGFLGTISHILWSYKTMPETVRQVCRVQFFAWMAWFPYMFYITSYVGDLYAAPLLASDAHMSMQRKVTIIEDAVRTGSLASLVFAIFAFLTSVVAPYFINSDPTRKQRASRLSPPIQRAWSISQLSLASCLFSTIFITDRRAAMILTAVVGISWAFALWVPFAIIGREIAARQERNASVMEGEIGPAQQDQAGAIMGLHNTAISLPQITAALSSSIIFWLVKSLGSEDGIGWVLRAGGCAALVASWLSSRMER